MSICCVGTKRAINPLNYHLYLCLHSTSWNKFIQHSDLCNQGCRVYLRRGIHMEVKCFVSQRCTGAVHDVQAKAPLPHLCALWLCIRMCRVVFQSLSWPSPLFLPQASHCVCVCAHQQTVCPVCSWLVCVCIEFSLCGTLDGQLARKLPHGFWAFMCHLCSHLHVENTLIKLMFVWMAPTYLTLHREQPLSQFQLYAVWHEILQDQAPEDCLCLQLHAILQIIHWLIRAQTESMQALCIPSFWNKGVASFWNGGKGSCLSSDYKLSFHWSNGNIWTNFSCKSCCFRAFHEINKEN